MTVVDTGIDYCDNDSAGFFFRNRIQLPCLPNVHVDIFCDIPGDRERAIVVVSGSSRRWKNSIEDIHDEALDPHRLYDIEVKQFKFNTDYIKDENDQRYDTLVPGFIAEQIQEHYPVAVDVDMETGEANDWNMKFIIPPMLALIQELNERVKSLERRR